MTEAQLEFQRSRRKFAVVDGEVIVQPKNSPQIMKDWFEDLGHSEDCFEKSLRGYYMEDRIVIYRGGNFDTDDNLIAEYFINRRDIETAAELPHNLEYHLHCGCVVSDTTVYAPIGILGPITSY